MIKMKLTKLKKTKDNLNISFQVSGCNEAFINSMRRLVIEEVPTLAIEDLEVKENSSALYDEMLALRLGLCPIKTDLKSYRLPTNKDEIEERAASCTLQMALKASKKGYVYADNATSKDPKCKFVYPKMPLTKLASKQKVDLIMYAVMGQGKEHIKWSPGLAWFKNKANLTIKNDKDLIEKFKSKYPSQIFEKDQISKDKIEKLGLCDAVDGICDDLIKVDYATDVFEFMLESWGQLTCNEILDEASNILIQKAEEMEKLI
jgi:DNA-directed RNA polymerase subunit D